ncbi:response regulator [Psychromonas ossibalaenae]|uniref:response regulator n=1 Tax=Psychromonas ossibalaenae TaxID=444922 RepID=UPI0003779EA0|nr:response regulator [Psychromonas ossibalaenae]
MKIILLAAASASLSASIEFALLQKNYHVVLTSDGKSALDYIAEKEVDLLITTLNLPLVDGLNLAEQLRNHSQNRFTPVLILIDEPLGEEEVASRGVAVNSYLSIPFTMDELLFKSAKLLSS